MLRRSILVIRRAPAEHETWEHAQGSLRNLLHLFQYGPRSESNPACHASQSPGTRLLGPDFPVHGTFPAEGSSCGDGGNGVGGGVGA